MKQYSVSASYMDTLLDAFVGAGCDRAFLLKKANLCETDFVDPDNRLSVETVTKAWKAARVITNNPMLGMLVGEHIRPGSFSVLGHLLMTAATLCEALEKASQFAVLVGDGGQLDVDFSDSKARLDYDLVDKNIPCRRERIEAIIASLVGFSRAITGRDILPLQVGFQHEPMGLRESYEAFFHRSPVFCTVGNFVVFSQQDLELPLQQANPALSAVLDSHAEKILTRVSELPLFLRQLRDSMESILTEGTPELDNVAAMLTLTPRSLQRKLAELNTSFQGQLDQMRQEKAVELLRNNEKSIGETAFLLGFADSASFNRAFKRWTGTPPGKWLEQNELK